MTTIDDNINIVANTVCSFFCIDRDSMEAKCRETDSKLPRQIAHYVSYFIFGKIAGYKRIGKVIGNKDHATAMHSCRVVSKLISTDKQVKAWVDNLIPHCLNNVGFQVATYNEFMPCI